MHLIRASNLRGLSTLFAYEPVRFAFGQEQLSAAVLDALRFGEDAGVGGPINVVVEKIDKGSWPICRSLKRLTKKLPVDNCLVFYWDFDGN